MAIYFADDKKFITCECGSRFFIEQVVKTITDEGKEYFAEDYGIQYTCSKCGKLSLQDTLHKTDREIRKILK